MGFDNKDTSRLTYMGNCVNVSSCSHQKLHDREEATRGSPHQRGDGTLAGAMNGSINATLARCNQQQPSKQPCTVAVPLSIYSLQPLARPGTPQWSGGLSRLLQQAQYFRTSPHAAESSHTQHTRSLQHDIRATCGTNGRLTSLCALTLTPRLSMSSTTCTSPSPAASTSVCFCNAKNQIDQ